MRLQQVKLGLTLIPALALAGCFGGSSSSSSDPDGPSAEVRVFHAASDAPAVDVYVNGETVLENVPFGGASAFMSVPLDATVAVNPAGSDESVFEQTLDLEEDSAITFVARNLDGEDPISLNVDRLNEPNEPPPAGEAQVRVLHVAAAGPAPVDVYLGLPDQPPAEIVEGAPVVGSLAFEADTGFLSIEEPGERRIVVTAAGDPDVVYDSGPVTIPSDLSITLAAIDGSRGVSPIATVALTGEEDVGPALVWQDVRPGVRLAHLSPNAGPVDVSLEWDDTSTTLEDVSYKDATGYIPFAGATDLTVDVAGLTPVPEFALEASTDYTLAVVGLAGGGDPELQILELEDDVTPTPAGVAYARAVHAATENTFFQDGGVDIYVNAPGTTDYSADPEFVRTGVQFGAATDYIEAGVFDYQVDVTVTNTTPDPAELSQALLLASRDRVTVFAIGDGDENEELELFRLDDAFDVEEFQE